MARMSRPWKGRVRRRSCVHRMQCFPRGRWRCVARPSLASASPSVVGRRCSPCLRSLLRRSGRASPRWRETDGDWMEVRRALRMQQGQHGRGAMKQRRGSMRAPPRRRQRHEAAMDRPRQQQQYARGDADGPGGGGPVGVAAAVAHPPPLRHIRMHRCCDLRLSASSSSVSAPLQSARVCPARIRRGPRRAFRGGAGSDD